MSALEFIASVAWPLTVLVIALLFRRPLTEALASATGKLSAGPFGLEWNRRVTDVEGDLGLPPSVSKGEIGGAAGKLDELAQDSPVAAIIESYGRIEIALRSLLEKRGVQGVGEQWHVPELANIAREHDLITEQTMKAIEGLGILRNLAAHGQERDLSPERAHEYVALTQGVLYAISSRA